jgi:hypothetical protein
MILKIKKEIENIENRINHLKGLICGIKKNIFKKKIILI